MTRTARYFLLAAVVLGAALLAILAGQAAAQAPTVRGALNNSHSGPTNGTWHSVPTKGQWHSVPTGGNWHSVPTNGGWHAEPMGGNWHSVPGTRPKHRVAGTARLDCSSLL
jgi:hypothetical protein